MGTRSLGDYYHDTMRAVPRYGSFDDAVMHNEDRLSSRKRTDLTKQGGDKTKIEEWQQDSKKKVGITFWSKLLFSQSSDGLILPFSHNCDSLTCLT